MKFGVYVIQDTASARLKKIVDRLSRVRFNSRMRRRNQDKTNDNLISQPAERSTGDAASIAGAPGCRRAGSDFQKTMKKQTKEYPRLETKKVKELKPHPDGVRTHNNDALYLLGKSVELFGLLRPPFVVNARTGNLLDGDLLAEALQQRDPEQEVPVWVVDLDDWLEDAAHLALQNHAGDWMWQQVSEQLKAVKERNIDPRMTGFHDSDIGPLTAADWKPAAKGPLDGSDAAQIGLL